MTDINPRRGNGVAIALGVVGILLEIAGIALMASKRMTVAAATPLIIVGMFMAFVPLFILARRAKRR